MTNSIVLFQKEMYKFQTEYLKEIMAKIGNTDLMTPELIELFDKELLELSHNVKDGIKNSKKKNKKNTDKKEKTPRQILLVANMAYIRSKYPKECGVVQTSIMTCGQYMTTQMVNDPDMLKYDALVEAIKMVNEKKGNTVFTEAEKDEVQYSSTNDALPNDSSNIEVDEEPKMEEEIIEPSTSKKTSKKKKDTN